MWVVESHGDGPVVVPGGRPGCSARRLRARGPDLLLTGASGEQAQIRDFFVHGTPPPLMTEGGARLSGELAARLAGPMAPGQMAAAGDAVGAEPIGRVETAEGVVSALHSDGTRVDLSKGDPVFQGDILETGGDGVVGVVFVDDSTFTLDANGRMTLDELVYDPGAQSGSLGIFAGPGRVHLRQRRDRQDRRRCDDH